MASITRPHPKFIFLSRHLSSRLIAVISGCIFFIILHYLLKWEEGDMNAFIRLDISIPENFSPVQITKRETLPTGGIPKIPKIIHQTWKNEDVPPEFVTWIKSWSDHHPDWEYWLWTDQSARKLISDKYPHLLDIYDGYLEPIRRADALRYIILHEYGGLYIDMDMEALSSILPLALKYSCFIGQEPFEHPIIDTNFDKLLINALIGCRKGHPFMKKLIDNLPAYSILWHYLDSTGPHFVTLLYRQYVNEPSNLEAENAVYVTPSEYFYPEIDPAKLKYMFTKCSEVKKLTKLQVRACQNLKFKSLPHNQFDPRTIAFANHHWYHTYLKTMSTSLAGHTSIFKIIPVAKIY
ncbi:uncharacterized protein LOC131953459 [Physella acuta]|uniref:uncharacterized protein LOC131953459 n=1 Tax=Physella acuta TaxID=109671 RepID=UPI0027DB856B|nr:uncharacterized protein LOC131953459 [Physella acuta]